MNTIEMVGEISGKFVPLEEYRKLEAKYNELNDFDKSQSAKMLRKISELEEKIHILETTAIEYESRLKDQNFIICDMKKQIDKMKNCRNCKHFIGNAPCKEYHGWKCRKASH